MMASGKSTIRPERLLRAQKKILQEIELPTGATRITRRPGVKAEFHIGILKDAMKQVEATAATTGATAKDIVIQVAAIAKAWNTKIRGAGYPGRKGPTWGSKGKGDKEIRNRDHYDRASYDQAGKRKQGRGAKEKQKNRKTKAAIRRDTLEERRWQSKKRLTHPQMQRIRRGVPKTPLQITRAYPHGHEHPK